MQAEFIINNLLRVDTFESLSEVTSSLVGATPTTFILRHVEILDLLLMKIPEIISAHGAFFTTPAQARGDRVSAFVSSLFVVLQNHFFTSEANFRLLVPNPRLADVLFLQLIPSFMAPSLSSQGVVCILNILEFASDIAQSSRAQSDEMFGSSAIICQLFELLGEVSAAIDKNRRFDEYSSEHVLGLPQLLEVVSRLLYRISKPMEEDEQHRRRFLHLCCGRKAAEAVKCSLRNSPDPTSTYACWTLALFARIVNYYGEGESDDDGVIGKTFTTTEFRNEVNDLLYRLDGEADWSDEISRGIIEKRFRKRVR